MDDRAKELIRQSDKLFADKSTLTSYHQDVAENFAPEYADFTASRFVGGEFAGNLISSAPLLANRDMTSMLSSMLRPETEWFFMGTSRDDRVDNQGKRWLEWATDLQRRAMYDPKARFKRATSEGDRFYVPFGQCVISVELNRKYNNLLYRCWHLRDCVWAENAAGDIDTIFRKWKPTVRDLAAQFPGRIAKEVSDKLEKEPFAKVNVLHCIVPSEDYRGVKKFRQPFVSVYVDVDNQHVMEEVGKWTAMYCIPRFLTLPGSQYAHSPAVIAALPTARLIQAVSLTLLEAGQKAVDPPMVMPEDKLRSDLQLYAGGITVYDDEYDERTGEFLRPIMIDKSGLQFGVATLDRAQQDLLKAFFLDKMGLAPVDPRMTAFQVAQVMQENVRNVLPLLGPTEEEYNGSLCNLTFDELRYGGAFGSPVDIPQSVRGMDVKFRFESPLHQAIEREKGQKFLQAVQVINDATPIYPVAPKMLSASAALRDALTGFGTPAEWITSEKDMAAIEQQAAAAQQAQAIMAGLHQAGETAQSMGAGAQSFQAVQGGMPQ